MYILGCYFVLWSDSITVGSNDNNIDKRDNYKYDKIGYRCKFKDSKS